MSRYSVLVALTLLGLTACGADGSDDDSNAAAASGGSGASAGSGGTAGGGTGGTLEVPIGFDDQARQELLDTGIDRYVGQIEPQDVIENEELGTTAYVYEPDPDKAICIFGEPFSWAYKDQGSEDLLIYLQGGGACWTGKCSANKRASLFVPPVGWTDGDVERNPVGGHNTAHVSYCDGSVFSGDNIFEEPGGRVRYHKGLANLSAALTILKEKMPQPRSIFLSGSSAGGYGTIISTALVRVMWPDTPLKVVNDAGLGLTNPEDPGLLDTLSEEWKFDQFLPASCEDCRDGQFSALISWALEHDPSLKVGAFSSYQDFVIGGAFLGMEGPDFRELVLAETGKIHDQHPERFKRYLIAGSDHTAVLGFYDMEVDGVKFIDWTHQLVNDDPAWPDVLAEPSPDAE